jgi:predicted DNA-binding transcriptional regulator YafY
MDRHSPEKRENADMSRTERLLDLIQKLRRHRLPVSGAQLADELTAPSAEAAGSSF